MIFNIKKIIELKNKKACSVCGTKCKYWYNDKFELEKTMCNGFRLSIIYKIILKIFRVKKEAEKNV
jgi:hypothetical protein